MELLILLIIIVPVIAVVMYLTNKVHKVDVTEVPMYLQPTDDKKWKRIVYLEYIGNVFTITTFDNNIRQFWKPADHHPWYRYPSKRLIGDVNFQKAIDKQFDILMDDGKRKGQGWVKVFS